MTSILTRKLQGFAALDDNDCRAVDALVTHPHTFEAGTELIREGERPHGVFLLLEGWAFRYKLLAGGRRQILAYLIPGDLCDIHVFILKTMDHGISLLGPGKVATLSPDRLLEVMDRHPRVERALWWATLVDEAILRQWLVNVGQRDAYTRTAHLLYEMWLRVRAVGLAAGAGGFSLPLTQEQLGDTIGLTPVAVNRALQRLRKQGVITLDQKWLTLLAPERLATISGFEGNYLHLDRGLSARR